MTQIQNYERPFNVVFGEDEGEAIVVEGPQGPDFPIWGARRFIMALLTTEIERVENDDQKAELRNLRHQFGEAHTGELIFGMVRRFKNRFGKTRFIGLVQKGQDYRTAGQQPTRTSSKHYHDDWRPPQRKATQPTTTKRPDVDPQQIADKMAKAARRAVEGDDH